MFSFPADGQKKISTILLREQFLDDLTARLAELLEAAFVEISPLVVIYSEQVKDCRVQILDRMDHFNGAFIPLVGGADDVSRLDNVAYASGSSRSQTLLADRQARRPVDGVAQ
jgi:hypothetical protein